MQRRNKLILGIVMMCMLTGCADNPESSVIQNKDFDNLIEEAENTEESVNMEEMSQEVEENYNTYVTTFSDTNLLVTVNVDAKVEIPTTEQLSIYRVKQADINQEFLDKVRNTLAPDVELYNGSVLHTQTKKDLEMDIKYYKDELQAIEDGTSGYVPEDIESARIRCEEELAILEAKYENAPEAYEIVENPSDYMLHAVAEKYAENPEDAFYSWQYNLTSEDDEVYYGISDGNNGEYISFYIQNNEDYGNVIRYSKNTIGHVFAPSVYVGDTSSYDLWKDGEKSQFANDNGINIECTDKETINISIEDAREEANILLKELGLNDFACSDEGIYNEIPDCRYANELYYRPVYKFTYLRIVDNTMVSNEAGSKHTEGWSEGDYVKKDWPGETVVVMVNDTGIVGFYYNAPIELTETVVDKSQLKSFDEIKGIFEGMVVIAYGSEDLGSIINVESVVLRYARISEADNYDSGLLVPVWDFVGTVNTGYDWGYSEDPKSVLTINAIDGSIIDHELGY